MSSRKRANKSQQKWLVNNLHANIELARGNRAELQVLQFWNQMARDLNKLGCSRTVSEWQHIWNVWAQRVKNKARKIRDAGRRPGAGPAGATLTPTEQQIIDIVGSAAINGFANAETPLEFENTRSPSSPCPLSPVFAQAAPFAPSPVPSSPAALAPMVATPPLPTPSPPPVTNLLDVSPAQRSRRMKRLRGHIIRPRSTAEARRGRTPRENLIRALNNNHAQFRTTIISAAEVLAAAIRESAEIIAAAMRSREEDHTTILSNIP